MTRLSAVITEATVSRETQPDVSCSKRVLQTALVPLAVETCGLFQYLLVSFINMSCANLANTSPPRFSLRVTGAVLNTFNP